MFSHTSFRVALLLFLGNMRETKRSVPVMLDPDPHTHVMNMNIMIRNNDYRIVVESGTTLEGGSGNGSRDTSKVGSPISFRNKCSKFGY
jgi:hypothetical protein